MRELQTTDEKSWRRICAPTSASDGDEEAAAAGADAAPGDDGFDRLIEGWLSSSFASCESRLRLAGEPFVASVSAVLAFFRGGVVGFDFGFDGRREPAVFDTGEGAFFFACFGAVFVSSASSSDELRLDDDPSSSSYDSSSSSSRLRF